MAVPLYRGAEYREAGVADIARMALGYLWEWIYRTGMTLDEVLDWFRNRFGPSRAAAVVAVPEDLVKAVARFMTLTRHDFGTFMLALEDQLQTPPPGYRWRKDKWGEQTLVKEGVSTTQPIVRGKRFADHVFIGIWWTTATPRGETNQSLQRFIRAHDGAVFWKPTRRGEDLQQYGAYIIEARDDADGAALDLCSTMDRIDVEGGGEHRLSAISMDGIAEHREVRPSDQVHLSCIRSRKLNWEYNLDDLLNGRIGAFKTSKVYQRLIQMLRET